LRGILYIKELRIKNFRCFPELTVSFDAPVVLIEGPNGCGKTSLLEAIHYLGYLRSFRTHLPRELVAVDQEDASFFIKASIEHDAQEHELQVGFAGKNRLVKLNQKAVQTFKDLTQFYRVVTLTEDDLAVIKGGPDARRSFLDAALMILDPEVLTHFRTLRQVLDQRNALLVQQGSRGSYDLWTEQLWDVSEVIANKRKDLLVRLQKRFDSLEQGSVHLEYVAKVVRKELEQPEFRDNEYRWKRSLFGAHLDDIAIRFYDRKSKLFASRGQQKRIVLYLKIALAQELEAMIGKPIMLLDDFMTDFDGPTVERLMTLLLNLDTQLMITVPSPSSGTLERSLTGIRHQKLLLENRVLPNSDLHIEQKVAS
jgi:DNA replication and repair protein RecF